jgi:tRNA(fMet)-specific endonuclease VapC
MKRYMLDTNTVSYLVRAHPQVTQRVVDAPMASLCISTVTEGELLFGVARRPQAVRLARTVHEFLSRVVALPWDSDVARCYGMLRAKTQGDGVNLTPLDMMIAAHAWSVNATLVTSDGAFSKLSLLEVEDWSL